MKPLISFGFPDVDDPLAEFPISLAVMGTFDQHRGYKGWKIPGRRENWLQWNDGDVRLPIRFDNSEGVIRTWKLFARFGKQPGQPWEKPARYEHDMKWMLGGPDVWGCSYEVLRGYLTRIQELSDHLIDELKLSHRYSIEQYR